MPTETEWLAMLDGSGVPLDPTPTPTPTPIPAPVPRPRPVVGNKPLSEEQWLQLAGDIPSRDLPPADFNLGESLRRGVADIGSAGAALPAIGEQLAATIHGGDDLETPVSEALANEARYRAATDEYLQAGKAPPTIIQEATRGAVQSAPMLPLAVALPAAAAPRAAGALGLSAIAATPGTAGTVAGSIGQDVATGEYTAPERLGRGALQGAAEFLPELLGIRGARGGEAALARALRGQATTKAVTAQTVPTLLKGAVPDAVAQSVQEALSGAGGAAADILTNKRAESPEEAFARIGHEGLVSSIAGGMMGGGSATIAPVVAGGREMLQDRALSQALARQAQQDAIQAGLPAQLNENLTEQGLQNQQYAPYGALPTVTAPMLPEGAGPGPVEVTPSDIARYEGAEQAGQPLPEPTPEEQAFLREQVQPDVADPNQYAAAAYPGPQERLQNEAVLEAETKAKLAQEQEDTLNRAILGEQIDQEAAAQQAVPPAPPIPPAKTMAEAPPEAPQDAHQAVQLARQDIEAEHQEAIQAINQARQAGTIGKAQAAPLRARLDAELTRRYSEAFDAIGGGKSVPIQPHMAETIGLPAPAKPKGKPNAQGTRRGPVTGRGQERPQGQAPEGLHLRQQADAGLPAPQTEEVTPAPAAPVQQQPPAPAAPQTKPFTGMREVHQARAEQRNEPPEIAAARQRVADFEAGQKSANAPISQSPTPTQPTQAAPESAPASEPTKNNRAGQEPSGAMPEGVTSEEPAEEATAHRLQGGEPFTGSDVADLRQHFPEGTTTTKTEQGVTFNTPGGTKVEVQFVGSIAASGEKAAGSADIIVRKDGTAIGRVKMVKGETSAGTAPHEFLHIAIGMGLVTPQEQATLLKAADALFAKRPDLQEMQKRYESLYAGRKNAKATVEEERMALAREYWKTHPDESPDVNRTVWQKIKDFFSDTLASMGIGQKSISAVLKSLDTGSVFERAPKAQPQSEEKLSLVSTRVPTAVKATENALTEKLVIGLESVKSNRKAFEKNVSAMEQYPNYRPDKKVTTADQKVERIIDHEVENLLWLHDQMDPKLRDRAKLWYDGARAITNRWTKDYGVPDRSVAAVLAALSPQKDWFMNVSLAKRVLDVVSDTKRHAWDAKMDEGIDLLVADLAAAKFPKTPPGKLADFRSKLEEIRGKSFDQLDGLQKAYFVRTYDRANSSRSFPVVTPEGDFVGAKTSKSGEDTKAAWGGFSTIAKAISAVEDPSMENISKLLGGEHKVRNFYNNIFDPKSTDGHVTIDTHAVAAALLRPLSGNSTEVDHNFAGAGSASSAISGSNGTYGIHAEAYRRAAEKRGILPREMQSITWEAVRGLFAPTFKAQAKNTEAADAIWNEYSEGRITAADARKQILKLAGGITAPEWSGSGSGAPEVEGPTSDQGELSGVGVSRGDTESVPGGTRARVAEAAAEETGTERFSLKGKREVSPDTGTTEEIEGEDRTGIRRLPRIGKEAGVFAVDRGTSTEVFGTNGNLTVYKDEDAGTWRIKDTETGFSSGLPGWSETKSQAIDKAGIWVGKTGERTYEYDGKTIKFSLQPSNVQKIQGAPITVTTGVTSHGLMLPPDKPVQQGAAQRILRRYLTHGGDLPKDVAERALVTNHQINGLTKEIAFVESDYRKAMKEAFGKKPTVDDRELVNAVLAGDKPLTALPHQLVPVMDKMRGLIDGITREGIRVGLFQGGILPTVLANLGVYLNRTYRVHNDPKWGEKVQPQVRNRAFSFIKAQDPSLSDADVDGIINEILTPDLKNPVPQGQKLGSKRLDFLLQKTKIPAPLRDLMGEYKDPLVNFANSYGKMAAAVENHKFLTDIKDNGKGVYFFDKPTVKDGISFTQEIAVEGSKSMAPLNGIYTTAEIAQAFKDHYGTSLFDQDSFGGKVLRLYATINGYTKYAKTVGNFPAGHVRNFASNALLAIANGHYTSKGAIGEGLAGNLKDMQSRMGFGGEKAREFHRRMIDLGIIGESVTAGELKSVIADAGIKNLDEFSDSLVKRGLAKSKNVLATSYELADSFWKINAFFHERAALAKGRPSLTEEELDSQAASRVIDTYPSYEKIAKIVKDLRRIPLIGTFTGFMSEMVRCTKNTVKIGIKDMQTPGMRATGAKRLVGTMVAMSIPHLIAAASRGLYNVDNDDEEAARRLAVAPWSKRSTLMWLGKNDKGQLQYADISWSDPWGFAKKSINAAFAGEFKDATTNLTAPFIGPSLLSTAVAEVWTNTKGAGGRVYNTGDTDEEKATKVTQHLLKTFEPGTLSMIRRMWKAETGYTELSGRTYTLDEEIMSAALGLRMSHVDVAQSLKYKSYDIADRYRAASANYNSTVKRVGATDEEKADALEKRDRVRDDIAAEAAQLYRDALGLGLTPAQANEALKAAKVPLYGKRVIHAKVAEADEAE